MRLALFPGTFDPFTHGHLDVLERGLRVFDAVEITVAVNAAKKPLLSLEERCALIQHSTRHLDGVSVSSLEGLLIEHARKRGAVALMRGLRQSKDFEYEQPMALANRQLFNKLETVFFLPSPELAFLSSSIVRDVYRWGGDISSFVPDPVLKALQAKKS